MPIDYSKYPPNWKSELVPAILRRANNCCEECGLKNGSTIWSVIFNIKNEEGRYLNRRIWFRSELDARREARGEDHRIKTVIVILTVAHLDHDETNKNVSLDRLRALCQACHLRYDAIEKYRRSAEKWDAQNPTLL